MGIFILMLTPEGLIRVSSCMEKKDILDSLKLIDKVLEMGKRDYAHELLIKLMEALNDEARKSESHKKDNQRS